MSEAKPQSTSSAGAIKGALRAFDRSRKGSGPGMTVDILAKAAFSGIGDSKGNWGHLIISIDP